MGIPFPGEGHAAGQICLTRGNALAEGRPILDRLKTQRHRTPHGGRQFGLDLPGHRHAIALGLSLGIEAEQRRGFRDANQDELAAASHPLHDAFGSGLGHRRQGSQQAEGGREKAGHGVSRHGKQLAAEKITQLGDNSGACQDFGASQGDCSQNTQQALTGCDAPSLSSAARSAC